MCLIRKLWCSRCKQTCFCPKNNLLYTFKTSFSHQVKLLVYVVHYVTKGLLQLLLECIKQPKPPLEKLQASFNHINSLYRDWAEVELQMQTASPSGVARPKTPTQRGVVIDQSDVYDHILQKLDHEDDLGKLEWVLITYMTSLSENNILVQHNINEMIVTTAVSIDLKPVISCKCTNSSYVYLLFWQCWFKFGKIKNG